jgi:hypothetical protein
MGRYLVILLISVSYDGEGSRWNILNPGKRIKDER